MEGCQVSTSLVLPAFHSRSCYALRRGRDAGFTLIELVISVAILGTVMVAITAALLISLKVVTESDARYPEIADRQFASAYFGGDAAEAKTISSSGTQKCGTGGTLVVEFVGNDFNSPTPSTATPTISTTVVSYVTEAGGTELRRLTCSSTATSPAYPLTPANTNVVVKNLSPATPPSVVCKDAAAAVVPVACSATSAVWLTVTVTLASGKEFSLSGTRRETA